MRKKNLLLKVLTLFSALPLAYNCVGQTSSESRGNECPAPPHGVFRQLTNSTLKLSTEYYDSLAPIRISKSHSDRWDLDVLGEVDPAYQFQLIANDNDSSRKRCEDIVDMKGMLISPTGKLFDFHRATFDHSSGRFTLTTVERDGIVYEGDIQFYSSPRPIEGGFVSGDVSLRASGKALGKVLMKFPIISFGYE